MNCLYKPVLLDNFISNGVNASRSEEQALLLRDLQINGWVGRHFSFYTLQSSFFNWSEATCLCGELRVGGEVITKTLFFFVSFVSLW